MPFQITHDFQLFSSNFYHKYSPFCLTLSVLLFARGISTPAKHELLKALLLYSKAVRFGTSVDSHESFVTFSIRLLSFMGL